MFRILRESRLSVLQALCCRLCRFAVLQALCTVGIVSLSSHVRPLEGSADHGLGHAQLHLMMLVFA